MIATAIAIISTIVSVIATVWPIVKYYDKRREKRLTDLAGKLLEPLDKIDKRLDNVEGTLKKQEIVNAKQENKFDVLEKQMNEMTGSINTNEKDRLKTEIIDFATKLRNNQQPSAEDFQHIHYVYDKYHRLHGNTYCDGLYSFITDCEKEYLAMARISERKDN